jgi:hypothetical protein
LFVSYPSKTSKKIFPGTQLSLTLPYLPRNQKTNIVYSVRCQSPWKEWTKYKHFLTLGNGYTPMRGNIHHENFGSWTKRHLEVGLWQLSTFSQREFRSWPSILDELKPKRRNGRPKVNGRKKNSYPKYAAWNRWKMWSSTLSYIKYFNKLIHL